MLSNQVQNVDMADLLILPWNILYNLGTTTVHKDKSVLSNKAVSWHASMKYIFPIEVHICKITALKDNKTQNSGNENKCTMGKKLKVENRVAFFHFLVTSPST